jgi:uncharacterized protein (TIGR03382 family)
MQPMAAVGTGTGAVGAVAGGEAPVDPSDPHEALTAVGCTASPASGGTLAIVLLSLVTLRVRRRTSPPASRAF